MLRNSRFVANHRGGDLLSNEHIIDAVGNFCFERVLIYYGEELDEPINHAIAVARLV